MVLQNVLYYSVSSAINPALEVNVPLEDRHVFECITPQLIECVKTIDAGFIFIGEENIYSHNMNVLRRIILGKNINIIIGVMPIFESLSGCTQCYVKLKDNTIVLDGIEYVFQPFEISKDSDEIIEYNTKQKTICYKPQYCYSSELAEIVRKGFDLSKVTVRRYSRTKLDEKRRIWNEGIGFPGQIYSYAIEHTAEYYCTLSEYVDVLVRLMEFSKTNAYSKELEDVLIQHFSYSTIFSFTLAKVSNDLACRISDASLLEKCYTAFSISSPINSKYTQTVPVLDKLKPFLKELADGNIDVIPVFFPEFSEIPVSQTLAMFLTMHIFSDVRRCVISMLIENNSWFKSICTHKRKETRVF